MISVQDVAFTIHRTTILHNISFAIPKIGISALVGENGAGKTTLIRLLSGYLQPSSGKIEILQRQHPDPTISIQMGILSENPPIYEELRVGEYLDFVAQIRSVQDIRKAKEHVLKLLELQDVEDSYISTLSKGFRQRVGLAQALIHQPKILILDEPFIGLDPVQKKSLRNTMLKIAEQSLIVLSSHNLDDIEQIASEIIFIEEGELKFHRDISQLREEQNQYVVVRFNMGTSVISIKELLKNNSITRIIPHLEQIKTQDAPSDNADMLYTEFLIKTTSDIPHHQIFESIVGFCRQHQLHIEEIYRYKPRLEEILLA